MKMRVWSLALLSELRSGVAMSYGNNRHNLDPALLWLRGKPAAASLIWPLALEHLYAAGVALKRKKKKSICGSSLVSQWVKGCVVTAVAQVPPLTQELLHAVGRPQKTFRLWWELYMSSWRLTVYLTILCMLDFEVVSIFSIINNFLKNSFACKCFLHYFLEELSRKTMGLGVVC